jgi:hypothetical protein
MKTIKRIKKGKKKLKQQKKPRTKIEETKK